MVLPVSRLQAARESDRRSGRNICKEYATKRYRSNVMNWGMLPFQMEADPEFEVGDYIYVPNVREALDGDLQNIKAYVIGDTIKELEPVHLRYDSRREKDRQSWMPDQL